MQLFVGLSSHQGSIKRYAFDILELLVSASFPKNRTLRQMRDERPELKFSLRLHPEVALAGPTHPDVARTAEAREALGASAIVLSTPPKFSPTERNRAALREFAQVLGSPTCSLAWEPKGVWNAEEIDALCSEHAMIPVRDLTREDTPAGPTVYTRLLALGSGARVSQHATEMLAARLEGRETAYVIIEVRGARATRTALRTAFELED